MLQHCYGISLMSENNSHIKCLTACLPQRNVYISGGFFCWLFLKQVNQKKCLYFWSFVFVFIFGTSLLKEISIFLFSIQCIHFLVIFYNKLTWKKEMSIFLVFVVILGYFYKLITKKCLYFWVGVVILRTSLPQRNVYISVFYINL